MVGLMLYWTVVAWLQNLHCITLGVLVLVLVLDMVVTLIRGSVVSMVLDAVYLSNDGVNLVAVYYWR
jgi:hypothetical protein